MDEETLVIDKERLVLLPATDGPKFVEALDASNFDYLAAFWLYQSEFDDWRLYIATPLVKKIGSKETYRLIQPILAKLQPPLDLSLSNITVISPDEPVVRVLRKVYHVDRGQRAVYVRRSMFEGVVIEGAIIYRML